jgi:hypothetical protein
MKLIIRASVLSLVFAGLAAGAFTQRATAFTTASTTPNYNLVISNRMPVPSCTPNQGCGIP